MKAEYFIFTIYTLEIIATIIASITFKEYRHTPSRYFLYLLWFTIFVELIGSIPAILYYFPTSGFSEFVHNKVPDFFYKGNYWLFNINRIITFMVYYLFILHYLKTPWMRRITIGIIGIIIAVFISELIIDPEIILKRAMPITKISGSLGYLIIGSFFLLETLRFEHKQHITAVIIIFGGMLYHLLTVPIFVFSNLIRVNTLAHYGILLFANIILYGSFCYAFITASGSNDETLVTDHLH
ncbi:hypothetical protein [Robertkochia solimangrovi]|uniref:hypothetical protein n=1 Tax=Robertkochia solimangrovi TaxID=2213046 RepID=UPI001181611D|nr:hypothetical protein [Robertkochia solimangrovi]TRZ42570.1 hypothetical protein DMZ48_13800 [Robertkochia solimangrovi]